MRNRAFSPTKTFDKFLSQYRYSRVFKVLKHHRPKKIYDFGCGQGELVNMLHAQGYDAYGVDVRAGKRVICADLNEPLPISSESADFITSLANLEHLNQPDVCLKEMNRILKTNGVLTLTTPSIAAKPILEFLAFKLKLIEPEEILDHKRYFTKKTLLKFLHEAGFNNVKVRRFQMGLNLHAYAIKS